MKIIPSSLLTVAALFAMQPSSPAALLVYEGFNYSSLANGANMAGTVSTATGLGAGSNTWQVSRNGGSAATTTSTYQTSGLTFSSNYPTNTGGSMQMRATYSTTDATIAASLQLSTGPVTGTLWSSYLVNYSAISNGGGGSFNQGYAADSAYNATYTFRNGQSSDALATNRKLTVGYDTTTVNSGNFQFAIGTTYLFISKYTNVGATLGGGTNGVATTWVLTSAQYDTWLALGGNESDLNANSSVRATDTVTAATGSPFTFDSTGYVQFRVGSPDFNSQVENGVVDELRYGNFLMDVVPEPSVGSFIMMGMAGLLIVSRRRRSGVHA